MNNIRFANILTLAVLLVGLYFAFSETETQQPTTVEMPIEVVGHNDVFGSEQDLTYTVERTVTLSAIPDSMYIRASRLGYNYTDYLHDNEHLYDQKADFRLNEGDWVSIDNETSSFFYPEYEFPGRTGPIGGPWEVLQVMLPADDAVEGENTVEFRFNGPKDDETSGYYVYELDFRNDRDGNSLMSSDIVRPDYEEWGPPEGYDNSDDISDGQALWTERNVLWDDANNREVIWASCADCHFTEGQDLKHFNFSNDAIITRAEFHGFSESEGKQIAAYIRSRDIGYPDGYDLNNCGGRPWSLPYQPAPGIDNMPGECFNTISTESGNEYELRLHEVIDGEANLIQIIELDPEIATSCEWGWHSNSRMPGENNTLDVVDIKR